MGSENIVDHQLLGIERFPKLLALLDSLLGLFRKLSEKDNVFLDEQVDQVFQQADDAHIRQRQEQSPGIRAHGVVEEIENFLIHDGLLLPGMRMRAAVQGDDLSILGPFYIQHGFALRSGFVSKGIYTFPNLTEFKNNMIFIKNIVTIRKKYNIDIMIKKQKYIKKGSKNYR